MKKRFTLALAVAALSVPAAAGAAQTSSQPASPSKASASKVKIYGAVNAITPSTVTVANATKSRTFSRGAVSLNGIRVGVRVEAEGFVRKGVLRLSSIHRDDHSAKSATQSVGTQPGDDRGGLVAGPNQPVSVEPGDDRGGLVVGPAAPVSTAPADDHGHGAGLDDAPGHH